MKLSNQIKLSITVLIITLSGTFSAFAGEWEDGMEAVNSCYQEYREAYKTLPDISVATSEEVIKVYDNALHPEICALALLQAYEIFEEVGYFQIIEYRNDFYDRKKAWSKVGKILDDWREHAAINHAGLRAELQKRKEIALQNTPKRSSAQIIIDNNNIVLECRRGIYKNNPDTPNLDRLAQSCAEANPRYTPDTRQFKCVGLCD